MHSSSLTRCSRRSRPEVSRTDSAPAAVRPPRIERRSFLGYALLAGGFALMVLGIFEIGGLFNLGFGFCVLWLGALIVLVRGPRSVSDDEEEEFKRIVDGL